MVRSRPKTWLRRRPGARRADWLRNALPDRLTSRHRVWHVRGGGLLGGGGLGRRLGWGGGGGGGGWGGWGGLQGGDETAVAYARVAG
jgi:hypothetical protein